jgi:PPM family protein phosphatase
MGCTLVMALFVGSAATLLNVGDSRAYRLRPQGIRQVTTDHSLVQRLIEIGQLTREEARHHPQKSIIYRVIGDTEDLAYDVYDVILQPGEALLFCSDGLSDMVEDDVLWRVWRAAASPDEACERLIALANEAGGYDNITVVIVEAGRG